MRILFILPNVDSSYKLSIHFGIAYIAGVLKSNGYKDIRFLSVSNINEYDYVIKEVLLFKPDIVGFTSVETQFTNVINISKRIKEVWKCAIVCGGVFPTIFPECLKDAECLDGVFCGESEMAFFKFVRAIEKGEDYHSVENFCFCDSQSGQIVKNNLLSQESNLDHLGFPDREIFNFQSVIDLQGNAAPFMFNRGCPYNCSFCSNHVLASVYGKRSNSTRKRSVDSCVAEIKDLGSRYRFDIIQIWDDLFTSDRKWLYEFLDKYKSDIKKPFMCTTRSNLCDEELFKRLKEGGCYRVHMSLESGNDFIRNKVMRRNISREKVVQSFNLANKYKIQTNASSIIGLPFETEEMIKETISLLGSLKVDSPGVNIFYPYIGTRLREVCEEYGLIEHERKHNIRERRESVLNLPHISSGKLHYYYDNFEDLVRQKEGILSYLKFKAKAVGRRIAKMILPYNMQNIIRKAKINKIKTENFPVNLES